MTPPQGAAKKPTPGNAPVYPELPKVTETPELKSPPPANGSEYIPPKAEKAKTPPTKEDLKNLLPFVGDEQVFGIHLKTIQSDKSGKYAKIHSALKEIRAYLKSGDSKQAATASEKVAAWLNDAALLEDVMGPTHARRTLIWVLKRVEGDPGADQIREALAKLYTAKEESASKSASGASKKEIQDSLEESKVFGDKLAAYKEESSKKYQNLTMALIYIGKVVNGDAKADIARIRIERWLQETELLNDPVALPARKYLIKALSVPTADATLGENLKVLVDALKANYGSPSDEKKPETKAPEIAAKPEGGEKKPETKAPETPAQAPTQNKASPVTFTYAPPKVPGKRQDNFSKMIVIIKEILQSTYTTYQKTYPTLSAETVMVFKTDNKNGAVVQVEFSNLQIPDPAHQDVVKLMLKQIADEMNKKISHEKQGSESHSEVEWPKISFKPPEKK